MREPGTRPVQKKPAAKKPAASGSAAPYAVSATDWSTVNTVANQYHIDPYLLVAIGVHETGWGTQGAGRQGYALGVGVPDSGGQQQQYQGLYNQLVGAAQILANYGVHNAQDLATGVLAPHGGQVRYASDPHWTSGVLSAYNQIKGTHFNAAKSSAGADSTGAGPLASSKPETVQQYLGNPDIASSYGYMAAYMKDPEVGPILAKAAQKGWNAGELLSALQKTHWWQKTGQTARQMQSLQREDPASYREQYNTQHTQIQALAQSMGISVPSHRLNQLTTTALWSGWSNLQIQEAVGAEFRYKPGQSYAGTAGADIQKFKGLAANYLVPLADKTLGSWTQQALQGKINPDDFSGYLSQQAKTLFPWMAHAIDGGVTPVQYLDPYKQAAAQTLELDPNSIDFTNPKWLGLVQTVDPKTGQRTESGLANAMVQMRTNPVYGYDKTQGARDQAAAFAASIAHQFGYQGDAGSGASGVSNPAA